MTKYNRPNGKLFGSSANNIGVFGSGQAGETYTTTTDPNTANSLGTHWEDGWNGAVVSQAPYTAPFIEDMNAVNYVNSYNSAYLLQRGIPEYDANEEYQADSVCTYNGEIWICLLDGTTGITPTEGANWHVQAEVPVMVDNEILVGQTGVGATKTDTLNQGDIVASTTGLDIKSGVIVNADISAGANIDESKVNLAYNTTTLNTAIGNVSGTLSSHTGNYLNPHQTTVSNLDDTNISLPNTDDTLVYDGVNSEWINQANTLDNLSNATITTPSNKDVLWYSGGSWVNTPDVNNHMVNKNNPHETKIANLNDANASTPSDQDALVYDGNSSKWINQANTLENLKNTNITTVSDGQILSYDSGNSEWINTTNSIDNLSNATITSASSGDVLSYNGSNWINQENSVDNLTNATITTPSSGDVLSYNGSGWVNQDNSLDNLTNTTITSASAGDILAYDNLNSKWINQANSVSNLSDTTISTLTSGDVLSYDGSKWINSQPAGGSLSNLTDTSLTTPQQNDVLLYDSGSSKWINSSIIEVNDIANINSASSNITLSSNSKRHQIFTATNGFNITLPSTGIKAGESFRFGWANDFDLTITTPFTFYSSNGTACQRAWVCNFDYIYTALVDNPVDKTDWKWNFVLTTPSVWSGYASATVTFTNGVYNSGNLGAMFNLPVGFLTINIFYNAGVPIGPGYGGWVSSWISSSGNTTGVPNYGGGYSSSYFITNMPMTDGANLQSTPLFKSLLTKNLVRSGGLNGGYGITPTASGDYVLSWNANASIYAPSSSVTDTIILA